MAKTLNVSIIGTGFMGRAHSQAWASVNRFFGDLPRRVTMKTACGTVAQKAVAVGLLGKSYDFSNRHAVSRFSASGVWVHWRPAYCFNRPAVLTFD